MNTERHRKYKLGKLGRKWDKLIKKFTSSPVFKIKPPEYKEGFGDNAQLVAEFLHEIDNNKFKEDDGTFVFSFDILKGL